jgi:ATP-dependent protease ClpP protease subunit
MMHPVSGGAMGNVFEVENQTKEMRALHDRMVAMLSKETKMKRSYIDKAVMERKVDHFLTPEEAIKLGIADKIIGLGE